MMSTCLLVLLALLVPVPALSRVCLCEVIAIGGMTAGGPPREPDAVFVGTALDVRPEGLGAQPREVRFVTEASWLGPLPDTVTLHVGDDAPCASYAAGGRYLVRAHRDSTGGYRARACDDGPPLGRASTRQQLARLGAPQWVARPYPNRAIDATVIPIGRRPSSSGPTVYLGLGFSAAEVRRVSIADESKTGSSGFIFQLPEGLYRLRVEWSDAAVSETYVSLRCDESSVRDGFCQIHRRIADLRFTLGPG